MAPETEFGFTVTPATSGPDGTWADFGFEVVPAGDGDFGFEVTPVANMDVILGAAPGAGVLQESWVVVTRSGGASMHPIDRADALEVSQGEEAAAATFALPAWTTDATGARVAPGIGVESDYCGAPPPGTETLGVEVWFRPKGEAPVAFDAMKKTRAVAAERGITKREGQTDGPLMALELAGTISQWEASTASYDIAYNHGKTHGQIAREIALAAGIPAACLSIDPDIGWPLYSPFTLHCEPTISSMRRVLDAAGYRLTDNREGEIHAYPLAPIGDEPHETISAEQIETGELEANVVAVDPREVPKCITVTGKLSTLPDDGDGWRTEETRTRVTKTFSVGGAYTFQQVTGAISTITGGGPLAAAEQLFSETVNRKIFYAGCLVATETEVWGYTKRVSARYQSAGGGGTTDGKPYTYILNVYFHDEGAVKDDQAQAYADQFEFWGLISFTRTVNTWSAGTSGLLTQTQRLEGRWLQRQTAWKTRVNPDDDWDAEVVESGVLLLGNDVPVLDQVEKFFIGPHLPTSGAGEVEAAWPGMPSGVSTVNLWASAETTVHTINADCFKTADGTTREGWRHRRGFTNLFAGGEEARDQNDIGDVTETEDVSYGTTGEMSHQAVAIIQDPDSGRGPVITTQDGLVGSLPLPEECATAIDALKNTVNVSQTICIGQCPTELWIGPANLVIEFDFGIETVAQAQFRAELEYRILTAPLVTVSRPLTIGDVGAPVSLALPEHSIDPAAYPHPSNAQKVEITSAWPPSGTGAMITTEIYRWFQR